jgi:hypothetical protein
METHSILRQWARAWVDECDQYAQWRCFNGNGDSVVDSPVCYGERTLMAFLARAWPFGVASKRGYRPLVAEFPTDRRKSRKMKKGGARIPDLWFARNQGDPGVLVEGKVSWATARARSGRFDWQRAEDAKVSWSITPVQLAEEAGKQLENARVSTERGALQGVVAVFVGCQVPLSKEMCTGERGAWWSGFKGGVEKSLKAAAKGRRYCLARWSSPAWSLLHNDTKKWNASRKTGVENVFCPYGWLLLCEYVPSIRINRA